MIETPEAKAEKAVKKDQHFTEFLERAESKLMLSLIPASDNPDAVKTLLRSAFDAGSAHGSGEILVEMVGALLKAPRRDEPKF